MNIVALCADANFLPYAHVVMESARKVANKKISFVLLFCGENNSGLQIIRQWANSNDINLKILLVDELNFNTRGIASYLSKATFSRLLLPELLQDFNKVLYLDCDILVRKDLTQLFETELGDTPLAAYWEAPYLKTPIIERINPLVKQLPDYFNAGVLLLNLQRWREMNLTNQLMTLSNSSSQQMYFADQDLLNTVLRGNYTKVSGTFNSITRILCRIRPWSLWTSKIIRKEFSDPHIVHFTDPGDKPWKYTGRTPYSNEFRTIMRELGYDYKIAPSNVSTAEWFSVIRQSFLGPGFDGWLVNIARNFSKRRV